MIENSLTGLLGKVKSATKQAADATVRQAKIARLRLDLMSLHGEKAKYLQAIGADILKLHKEKSTFDQTKLFGQLQSQLDNIQSVDKRIEALEAQLEAQHADNIEVKDVTSN